MNDRTKVPLCSTGHRPLQGRCPAYHHLQSPTYKAGQRVSLTLYCPWATGFLFFSLDLQLSQVELNLQSHLSQYFSSCYNQLFFLYSRWFTSFGPHALYDFRWFSHYLLASVALQVSSKWKVWHRFNKAGYTATQVACGWAGAIFEVTRPFGQEQWGPKIKIIEKVKCDQQTDRQTNRQSGV